MKHILVSQRISLIPEYGEERDSLDVRWCDFCVKAGLVPVLFPANGNVGLYFDEFRIEGVLLTGGNDLAIFDPSQVNVKRDRLEEELVNAALSREMPVLGICRGAQFIAHMFCGILCQVEGHSGTHHRIEGCEESRFGLEVGEDDFVNSYHNYGVSKEPDEFSVIARCGDGTVEAFEHRSRRIMGIMWHPERNGPFCGSDLTLFSTFFRA